MAIRIIDRIEAEFRIRRNRDADTDVSFVCFSRAIARAGSSRCS
jgi:hypothetical protein